jgi:hypothetical protein
LAIFSVNHFPSSTKDGARLNERDNKMEKHQNLSETKNMPEDGHMTKGGQVNPDHNGENKTESTSKDVTSQETETHEAAVQTMEPTMESMAYMGMDSTSVTDIAIVETDIPKKSGKSIDAWIGRVDNPGEGKKLSKEKIIEAGIKLA